MWETFPRDFFLCVFFRVKRFNWVGFSFTHKFLGPFSIGSTNFFGRWDQLLSSQFLGPFSIGSTHFLGSEFNYCLLVLLIFLGGEFNSCLHNSWGLFLLVHSFFFVVSSIIVFTILAASFYWFTHSFGWLVQLLSSQFLGLLSIGSTLFFFF